MISFRFARPLSAASVLFCIVSSAQALSSPPIRMAQGVEYMCGGRDHAEAAFMRTVAPRWAAVLEFGISRTAAAELPAKVRVLVRERYSGRPVMDASAEAPFMLARLEPGAYEIEATMGGITLQQSLVVFGGRSSRAAFVWPSNVDFAAAAERVRLSERQASARRGD